MLLDLLSGAVDLALEVCHRLLGVGHQLLGLALLELLLVNLCLEHLYALVLLLDNLAELLDFLLLVSNIHVSPRQLRVLALDHGSVLSDLLLQLLLEGTHKRIHHLVARLFNFELTS